MTWDHLASATVDVEDRSGTRKRDYVRSLITQKISCKHEKPSNQILQETVEHELSELFITGNGDKREELKPVC